MTTPFPFTRWREAAPRTWFGWSSSPQQFYVIEKVKP